MTEKQTYTDSFLGAMLVIFLLVGAMLVGMWIVAGGTELDLSMSVIVLGVMLLSLFSIMMLVYSFATIRRVICDSVFCMVASRSVWRRDEPRRFAWAEVKGTRIESTIIGSIRYRAEVVSFVADTGVGAIELMREQKFAKDFVELVRTVNRMTPKLRYVWVRGKEANGRRIIESVGRYHKVPRN